MFTLMLSLAIPPAHATWYYICPSSRCTLGYLDSEAHIHEPDASGRYRVIIGVFDGSLRATVDNTGVTSTTAAAVARYGVPSSESRGATAFYYGSSSVSLTSTRPGASTIDVNVTATGADGAEYQIWIVY